MTSPLVVAFQGPMAGVHYGVRPLDPLTFAAVSALVGAIACSPACPHGGPRAWIR